MHPEIKEALLRFRQRELWALQDEIRRAESVRLDEEFERRKAANAAQVERENAAADNYRSGYKAGFEAAWKLPR
jgi:hypothetical protein